MAGELAGRVALITGVGRVGQIGHAVATGFGSAGARLVLADRSAETLDERVREFAAARIEAAAAPGDLTEPHAARAAVGLAEARFGGLDIVVNVEGGGFAGQQVARMGGDEFTLVVEQISGPLDCEAIAQKVLDALAGPYNLGGDCLTTSASLGISIFPGDGADPESLLKNADIAMYRAKQNHNCFRFFSAPEAR